MRQEKRTREALAFAPQPGTSPLHPDSEKHTHSHFLLIPRFVPHFQSHKAILTSLFCPLVPWHR